MSLVFAFLPFLLVDLIEPARFWRVGSGLQALYFFGISVHRFRQASVDGIANAIGISRTRWIIQAAVVSVLVANASWYASPSLYVLGVLWSVFIAFMTFATLLLEASRQSAAESLPAD